MVESIDDALTSLANACRQKFKQNGTLTIDAMTDLVLKSGGEDIVKVMSKQDLNKVTTNGSYILEDVAGSTNLPTDPDSNNTSMGGATIRVISNDAHTKVSQDLIELSKGYKYVRSTNDGSNWTTWSVLTPYS